jgi:hypothetical protein
MSLKPCKECGREVSTKAKNCPNCGAPIPTRIKLSVIIVITLGLGFAWLIALSTPNQDKKGQQEKVVRSATSVSVPKESILDHDKKESQDEVASIKNAIDDLLAKEMLEREKLQRDKAERETKELVEREEQAYQIDDLNVEEVLEREKLQRDKAEREAKELQKRKEREEEEARERAKVEEIKRKTTVKKLGENSDLKNGYELGKGPKPELIYEIINESRIPEIKMSIDVRLKRKISQEALEMIANNLYWENDGPSYERVFIAYYLPKMEVGAGAWATSHFTPFLEVKILGFTEEEELALLDEENDSPLEIIGKWKDLAWPAVITIYRERGVLFMDLEFGKESMFKGANIKKEMISEAIMGQTRFREKDGNPHGEYYAIDSKGDLSMYDSEGFIRTAQSLGTF